MRYFILTILSTFILSASAQKPSTTDTNTINREIQASPKVYQPIGNEILPVNIAAPTITMDTQPGPLSVMIPQVTLKGVQKDWQHYAGMGSKGKATITNGQYTQYAAVNKNISADPFNITAGILATTEGVRVSVWLSDNNNFQNSKNSTSDRDQALQKYLHDFAVKEYRDCVTNELKCGNERQKALEADLTKLVKEEEKATKNTEENRRAILKANDAIATQKSDIVAMTGKIEAQKGMVDNTAADPNATKGAKKTLHDLEDSKVKLQRQSDKESKNIETWTNEIRANDRSIADIRGKQAAKRTDIEQQKQRVQSIQSKLEGIR